LIDILDLVDNSLNHEMEMGLVNIQSIQNRTLEAEKGSSCIYLRLKNRTTEANIRQRFRTTELYRLWCRLPLIYFQVLRIDANRLTGMSKIGRRKSDGWLWKRIFDGMGTSGDIVAEGRFRRQMHHYRQWIHRMRDFEFAGSTSRLAA